MATGLLQVQNQQLELTRYQDGAMLRICNAEMIAFDSGEVVVLTHNPIESTLARLVHMFLNRDMTLEEW